jgi:hypothetical protein
MFPFRTQLDRSPGSYAGRGPVAAGAEVTVRHSARGDASRIRELAALDSRRAPTGALLVAEVDGELVAAVSLAGEGAVADPFRPTADVVTLLELRAAQVAGADGAPAPERPARPRAEAALA